MANYFGADVHARYQAGFKVKNLPGCDFVITKCTGGTSFKIDGWLGMLDGASKTGVYHYARERGYQGTAKQEAENFISEAKKAPSDAMLVLDWEEATNTNLGDTAWVLEWCQIVEKALGRKPVIYTGNSVLNQHSVWWNWSNEHKYYLWYARYPSTSKVGWIQKDFPNVPNWPDEYVGIWQYSSAGGVPGWSGALDLNIAYKDWDLMVGKKKEENMSTNAVSWAKSMVGKGGYAGMCEKFVRTAFGFSAKYSTATLAWQASKAAGPVHTNTYNAPAGVPVFWGLTHEPAGHVAVSIGGGKAVSTSNKYGTPGICIIDIADYSKNAVGGTTYRGWAEFYHGQRVYNTSPVSTLYAGKLDGDFSSMSVESLQQWLRRRKYYDRKIDGVMGVETWKGVQRWLAKDKYYTGVGNGVANPDTVKGIQKALQNAGYYKNYLVDGVFGTETKRAWQEYLSKHI